MTYVDSIRESSRDISIGIDTFRLTCKSRTVVGVHLENDSKMTLRMQKRGREPSSIRKAKLC